MHKAPARVARSLIYGAHCFAPHLVRLVRVAFKRLADLTLSGGMIGDAARERCVARVCLEGGFQEPVLSAAPSTTRGLWLTTRAEDALDTGALLVRTEKNGADRAPRQNSF